MSTETIRLRDGTDALVRPIAPSDKDRLRRGFERLSDESRRRRFFAGKAELSPRELAYLTDVDHHDHEALLALDPRDGEAIGVARYVRSSAHPDEAEVAVTVADDWQGRGLGTQLLERLVDRARAEGIERFDALVLSDNRPMFDLLRDLGTCDRTFADGGTVEVHVPLQGPAAPRRSGTRSLSNA